MQPTNDSRLSIAKISEEFAFMPNVMRILHESELGRYERMNSRRAAHFIHGRYALKQLYKPFDMSSVLVEPDAFGKPSIAGEPEVFCSISHTDEYAASALSTRAKIGVDIEMLGKRHEALLRQIASADEIDECIKRYRPEDATVAIWAIKEAVFKADMGPHAFADYRINFSKGIVERNDMHTWNIQLFHSGDHMLAFAEELVSSN